MHTATQFVRTDFPQVEPVGEHTTTVQLHAVAVDATQLAAPTSEIEDIVGHNLARLRALHHLSLDGLARKSGVSRAMLAQIESGRSVPTIRVLQRIATALQVSVAAFLRDFAPQGFAVLPLRESPRLVSANGQFSSRALQPEGEHRFEFHALTLAAQGSEHFAALPPGTQKNLVVSQGVLEINLQARRQLLTAGDAIFFDADQPQRIFNPGQFDAIGYVVTQYAESRSV